MIEISRLITFAEVKKIAPKRVICELNSQLRDGFEKNHAVSRRVLAVHHLRCGRFLLDRNSGADAPPGAG